MGGEEEMCILEMLNHRKCREENRERRGLMESQHVVHPKVPELALGMSTLTVLGRTWPIGG